MREARQEEDGIQRVNLRKPAMNQLSTKTSGLLLLPLRSMQRRGGKRTPLPEQVKGLQTTNPAGLSRSRCWWMRSRLQVESGQLLREIASSDLSAGSTILYIYVYMSSCLVVVGGGERR